MNRAVRAGLAGLLTVLAGGCSFSLSDLIADGLVGGLSDTIATVLSTLILSVIQPGP